MWQITCNLSIIGTYISNRHNFGWEGRTNKKFIFLEMPEVPHYMLLQKFDSQEHIPLS